MKSAVVSGDPKRGVKVTVTGTFPDGLHDLRVVGQALRPRAHALAEHLARGIARQTGLLVTVPRDLICQVLLVLLAMPRTKLGRPRMSSTGDALKLTQAERASVRQAARIIASTTGEPPEAIRSRLRGLKRRLPKRGG